MNKAISKAVMNSTRLRNKFLKNRSAENKLAYNRQRNYCFSLTRKLKRDYYSNLDNRNVTDNNFFWKQLNLFPVIKALWEKITLIVNDEIINNNKEIFNNFFSSTVAQLNIPKYEDLSANSVNSEDSLENLVTKHKNHPSIKALLGKYPNTFSDKKFKT